MMRAACAILALLACACGPPRSLVPSAARSALVVTFGASGVLDVLRVQPPVELPLDDAVVDLWVLEYDVEPDALPYATMAPRPGDPEGVVGLVLAQPGEPDALVFAPPRRAVGLEGRVVDGMALPSELANVRLQRAACPSFDVQWIELAIPSRVSLSLLVDEATAIVGLEDPCVGRPCAAARLGRLGPRGMLRPLEASLRDGIVGASFFSNGLFTRRLSDGTAELAIVRTATIVERRRLSLAPLTLGPVEQVDTVSAPEGPAPDGIDLLRFGDDEDWALVEAGGVKQILHRARGERWSLVAQGARRDVPVREFCDVGYSAQFLEPKGPGRAWVGALDLPVAEAAPAGVRQNLVDAERVCRVGYAQTRDGIDVVVRNPDFVFESRLAWSFDGRPFSETRATGGGVRMFAPLGSGALMMSGQDVYWVDVRGVRLGVEPRLCPVFTAPDTLWTAAAAPDGVVLSGEGHLLWVGAVDR